MVGMTIASMMASASSRIMRSPRPTGPTGARIPPSHPPRRNVSASGASELVRRAWHMGTWVLGTLHTQRGFLSAIGVPVERAWHVRRRIACTFVRTCAKEGRRTNNLTGICAGAQHCIQRTNETSNAEWMMRPVPSIAMALSIHGALQALCVPRHHAVRDQGHGTGGRDEFLCASSSLGGQGLGAGARARRRLDHEIVGWITSRPS